MPERAKEPLVLLSSRYEMLRQVGEGGMGTIHVAHDRNLDCDVVIKMPRRSALEEPGFAERFALEIRSLVQLAHPHVVKIQDVGYHDAVPFCVMQYLAGGNLLDRGIPASVNSLEQWLPGVSEALDFVHQQGYLHRDVKPANILFDAHGNAYISDFGVARVFASQKTDQGAARITGAGLIVGTPEYLAPELIMGRRDVDGRADQFALAMTVYEVLAGRLPFDVTDPTAILVMHTTAPLPSLRKYAPHVPEALAAVVARGLSKDPSKRYADCSAFTRAVIALAGPSPSMETTLPPPPPVKPATGTTGARLEPNSGQARRSSSANNPARVARSSGAQLPPPPPPPTRGSGTTARPSSRPSSSTRNEFAPPSSPGIPAPRRTSSTRNESGSPSRSTEPTPQKPVSPRSGAVAPPPPKQGKSVLARAMLVLVALVVIGAAALGGVWGVRELQNRKGKETGGTTANSSANLFSFHQLEDVSLRPRETKKVDVRINRGGIEGTIHLTCHDLPRGLHVSPAAIEDGKRSATLTLEADGNAAPGDSKVRVTGRIGEREQSTDLVVRILSAPELRAKLPEVLPTLLIGDEDVPLKFTVTRTASDDKPVHFHVDVDVPGVEVLPSKGELHANEDNKEIRVWATGAVGAVKTVKLTLTVNLPAPNPIEHQVVANLRIDQPQIQLGRLSMSPRGKRFEFTAPISRNGFKRPLKFSIDTDPKDQFNIVSRPNESQGYVRFALERKSGKSEATTEIHLHAVLGRDPLPGPAQFTLVRGSTPITVLPGGPNNLSRLLFVAGGKRLVALAGGTKKGSFTVWSANDWLRPPYQSPIGDLLFHPEGKWFLSRTGAKMNVWSLEDDKGRVRTLDQDSAHAGIALSADGSCLAVRSLRPVTTTKLGSGGVRVNGVVPSRTDTKDVPFFNLYDTSSWKATRKIEDVLPQGELAVVGSRSRILIEGKPRQYRVIQVFPEKELYTLTGNNYIRLELSSDEAYLVAVSNNGIVRVLDPATGKDRFVTPPPASTDATVRTTFVPFSNLLAVIVDNESCSLWDLKTNKKVRALDGKPDTPIEFSADGKMAWDDRHVWNLEDGKVLFRLPRGRLLGISPGGTSVLAGEGGKVRKFKMTDSQYHFEVETHAGSTVAAAVLSPDGKTLAAGDSSGDVKVVEVAAVVQK